MGKLTGNGKPLHDSINVLNPETGGNIIVAISVHHTETAHVVVKNGAKGIKGDQWVDEGENITIADVEIEHQRSGIER